AGQDRRGEAVPRGRERRCAVEQLRDGVGEQRSGHKPRHDAESDSRFHGVSSLDETASTTRIGSSSARSAASAASRLEGASKTKKQISSSGTWIERSNVIRVHSFVSSSAAERARRSRATRSPPRPRARYVSTR